MRFSLFVIALTLLLSQYSFSQENDPGFSFDLSVRYRFELFNGYNAKNYGDDSPDGLGDLNDKILLQKIIPGLTYKKNNISAVIHIQDSRAFGWSLRNEIYPDLYKYCEYGYNDRYYTMNPQEEYFEIYDLYLEYKELFKNLSFKIGRQKIFYGDYRIFEPSTWGNTGRWTWDAVKISYRKNDNFIDIFGGGTMTHDPLKISIPFTHTEFWGGGIYAHKDLTSWLNVEPFYAIKTEGSADYISEKTFNRNWIGLKLLSSENLNLIFDLLYTHEYGREEGMRINASGLALKAGYRFDNLPASPELSLHYTYASGEKKDDDIIQGFDPPFGARARFYGWMGIVSWTNISVPQFAFKLNPAENRLLIELKHSRFYEPEPGNCVVLNTMKIKEGSHYLGNETDLYTRFQLDNHWQFTGILGLFNPGDLEQINFRDPENASWMCFQVQYTFN